MDDFLTKFPVLVLAGTAISGAAYLEAKAKAKDMVSEYKAKALQKSTLRPRPASRTTTLLIGAKPPGGMEPRI